jgi:DNA-binding CsgD family transcriptional regulator
MEATAEASAADVVGRDEERRVIGRFLDRHRPACLLLEGEAGIGKTTLWQFALQTARNRDDRALSWRAAASERDVAFAALIGLLDVPDLTESLAELNPPRRSALEVALRLAAPGDQPPDPALVGMAVVDLLRGLAQRGPLAVGLDDLQWCDRASHDALAFAARRLGIEPIAWVLSRRVDGEAPADPLSEALPAERRESLVVGPMTVGAMGRLIHDRLGVAHPRPLLIRLHEATGGNPFVAIELTRTLVARGTRPGPGEPFPVPPQAAPLVRDHLAELTPGARRALTIIAMSSHPTLGLLERVMGPEAEAAVGDACRKDAMTIEDRVLRPAHPLLASTAYADASPGERRRLRMALAGAVDDPVERAIHLAATADAADARAARALEEAARSALARGAPGPAGDLFERAAGLAEDEDHAVAMRIEGARAGMKAGDAVRAEATLRSVLDHVHSGRRRAEALLELGELLYADRPPEALSVLREALEHTEGSGPLEGTVHSYIAAMADDDPDQALVSVLAATEIVDRLGQEADPDSLACALFERAYHRLFRAEAMSTGDIHRGMAALPRTGDTFLGRRARELAERVLYHQGRLRESLAIVQGEYRRLADRGEVGLLPPLIQEMAVVHQLLGEWDLARQRAEECMELVQQGEEVWRQRAVMAQARVLAWEGDLDAARSLALEALAREEAEGDVWEATIFSVLAGFVELSVPDPARALAHLLRADGYAERVGVVLPTVFRYLGDLVEAAVLAGDVDLAERHLVEGLERPAERVPLPWIQAMAARARGLVAAARGELDRAALALDRSVETLSEACPMPFERARSLLYRGQVHRKAGRRREARADIDAAISAFRALGAKAWAGRAEEELGHLSGRVASGWGLTPSERRVAELAAAGRSNRELAAELFLSVRTVESQLSAAYRKLGVRSRNQLAAALSHRAPTRSS